MSWNVVASSKQWNRNLSPGLCDYKPLVFTLCHGEHCFSVRLNKDENLANTPKMSLDLAPGLGREGKVLEGGKHSSPLAHTFDLSNGPTMSKK